METDTTVHILRTLDDDSFEPPGVDLTAAMRVGDKRLRRRRMANTSLAVAAIVAVIAAVPISIHLVRGTESHHTAITGGTPSASASSLTCTEQVLATPKSGRVSVEGGDPTGRYIFGRMSAGTSETAVIWDNGHLTTVNIPGSDVFLSDVNSSGAAVGYSTVAAPTASDPRATDTAGWMYQNGTVTRLKGPSEVTPEVIGADGVIAGYETATDGSMYPIIWHSATATAVRLSLPAAGWTGYVNGVDSDGTILGTIYPPKSALSRSVLWSPDGTLRILPLPTGVVRDAVMMQSWSIQNGVIYALVGVPPGTAITLFTGPPVSYDLATGKYTLLHLASERSVSDDWFVTWDANNPGAIVVPPFGPMELPGLTHHSSSWSGSIEAVRTGVSGLIIAGADSDKNNVVRSVEWICR